MAIDLVDPNTPEGTTRVISVTVEATDEVGNPASATASTEVLVRPVQQVQFTDNFVDGVTFSTTSGLTGTTGVNESTGGAAAQGAFLFRAGDEITLTIDRWYDGHVDVSRSGFCERWWHFADG